jgi:hypothetical protein
MIVAYEKKDESGLEVDALFWGVFPGKSIFSQLVELIHRQQFRRCVGALSWQLQGQIVFVLGSVFVHGLCEPAMIAISRFC